jgi:sigma-E factor negative regulatory protein RseB
LQVEGVGYLATIVGEIPPATAERIAASFPFTTAEMAQ